MKKLIISIGIISVAASAMFVASIDHANNQPKKEELTQVAQNESSKYSQDDSVYDSRPKGLHGLVWGDNLSKLKNTHLVTDNKNNFNFNGYYINSDNFPVEQCYVKNHEQLALGKSHLARIEYCFMNNQFSSFKLFVSVSHPIKHDGEIEYTSSEEEQLQFHNFEDSVSLMYPIPPSQAGNATYLTSLNFSSKYIWDERIKTDPDATETNKIDITFQRYNNSLSYLQVSNEGYYHPFSEKIKEKYVVYQKSHLKEQVSQEN
jgi:hypothetical protein